jgi:hypothetical protein
MAIYGTAVLFTSTVYFYYYVCCDGGMGIVYIRVPHSYSISTAPYGWVAHK